MGNAAPYKNRSIPAPVPGPPGSLLPEPLGFTSVYFTSGLCLMCTQPPIGKLPHQRLMHDWPIWLNAKYVFTQICFPDYLACDVSHLNLHRLSPTLHNTGFASFFNHNQPATRTWHCSLDRNQIALRVNQHHLQILDSDTIIAHSARHPQSLHNAPRRRARADGTRRTPPVRLTVRFGTSPKPVALDNTGEPASFGGAYHIDPISHLKDAGIESLSFAQVTMIRYAKFT
jgi:hypothetical protein